MPSRKRDTSEAQSEAPSLARRAYEVSLARAGKRRCPLDQFAQGEHAAFEALPSVQVLPVSAPPGRWARLPDEPVRAAVAAAYCVNVPLEAFASATAEPDKPACLAELRVDATDGTAAAAPAFARLLLSEAPAAGPKRRGVAPRQRPHFEQSFLPPGSDSRLPRTTALLEEVLRPEGEALVPVGVRVMLLNLDHQRNQMRVWAAWQECADPPPQL